MTMILTIHNSSPFRNGLLTRKTSRRKPSKQDNGGAKISFYRLSKYCDGPVEARAGTGPVNSGVGV